LTILDFSSGDNHTIVLTNQGVWSFGSNANNLTFKKGYPTSLETDSLINAIKINLLSNSNQFQIIKIKAYKNSSIVQDDKGFIYIFGNINKLYNIHQIYKINDLHHLIDFCCNNTNVFLLTYFNDVFTLVQNNEPSVLEFSNDFYGTSIKSRGSILIGSCRFYKPTIKNSLFVDNFIGIGSNIIYDNKYSLIINGNINLINGDIYKNGILQSSSTSTSTSPSSSIIGIWNKFNNDIFYDSGQVGIGLLKPKSLLHVAGSTIIESNLLIKGQLYTSDYKPIAINERRNIYYHGNFGINHNNPTHSIDIYDGSLKITDVLPISNIIPFNSFTCNIINNSLNTPYINPILISQDSSTIINSFYNKELNDNNHNNSNVVIYKYNSSIRNWNTYYIRDIINGDTAFGQSISMTNDGSNIFIGAYKEKNVLGFMTTLTGGIYKYSFDNTTHKYIKSPTRELSINQNNSYNLIGYNICCSGDGSTLVSTIFNNNYLLYIKDFNKNHIQLLDFSPFSLFHSSFIFNITISDIYDNAFNTDDIFIDSTDDGSIIIINFVFDNTNQLISSFIYYNFYIIKNYKIYFLKFNSSLTSNSYITSLSITADGSKLFITTLSGYHFIFDINLDYDEIKEDNLNSSTIIYYYDIQPSYVFYKRDNRAGYSPYRGKIAKSGSAFEIHNNNHVIYYKN